MPAENRAATLDDAAGARRERTPAVIRILTFATFIVILNETIMINAIPRLMDDLRISETSAQWLSTAFMLTMAAVIPVTGWFLQRVATRTAYATAMAVFCAGTLLAAVSPTFELLLAGRIVQAAGTAVMMPLLMTTMMTVVPQEDRGRVMGNVTMAMSVAPAMGPAVAGIVLQLGSWRLLFLLVLPIAALITWRGLAKLENIGEPQLSTIDWFSVIAAALGFGALVYGLTQFGEGHESAAVVFIAAGLVSVTVFVLRQLRLQRGGAPLMDLRTLKHRTYGLALLLMAVAFMAMLGSMILLTLYLQNLRGLSALETGLLVMPGGLAMGLLGPSVGRLFDRLGGRVLMVPGAVGIVVALGGLSRVSMDTPMWQLVGLHMLLMVSLAGVFTPVFTIGLGALPMHLYSHGSSMLGTLQQVAAAFGTALVVTITTIRAEGLVEDGVDAASAQLDGMRTAFLVSALIAIGVVGLALLLPNRLPPAAGAHGAPAGEDATGEPMADHDEVDGAAVATVVVDRDELEDPDGLEAAARR